VAVKVPAAHDPVIRNGKKPKPSLRAGKGAFAKTKAAKYPDGVTVTIERVKHQAEKGRGPGAFTGRADTMLAIAVTNRSKQAIDLTSVVVTTSYGKPAQLAAPVYDDPAVGDFSGSLKPGATATATYAFAIPAKQRGHVETTVDFDATHVPAEFAGTTS
jgi:hypothetical protein